ncbi:hypothetical protein LCGC14_0888740 [marine sediment metagenome]|uniref:Uncharacterized protein n=1 Tax=marine sediment metagenome TaxID=412755 RepID=A0A0F9RJ46_9ZZZZ
MREFDELEKLHQELKREYFKWAKGKIQNNGYGSDNNSETTKFLKNHSNMVYGVKKTLKKIKTNLKSIKNKEQKYNSLREIYIIHPSFHEMWFFNKHFNHFYGSSRIINGRGGLKSYITSVNNGTIDKRLKIITTWVFKRTILLENLFSGVLDISLFDCDILSNKELDQNLRITTMVPIKTAEEVKSQINSLFRICHTLLEKTNYATLENNNLLSNDAWLYYAQCNVNEGPIFIKESNETRLDIFKKIRTINQIEIRKKLLQNFKIEIIDH